MYDEIKKTAKENNNIISLPDGNFRPVNPKLLLRKGVKNVMLYLILNLRLNG